MYKFIVNPITKKQININSKKGIQLLRRYVDEFFGGASTSSEVNNDMIFISSINSFVNKSDFFNPETDIKVNNYYLNISNQAGEKIMRVIKVIDKGISKNMWKVQFYDDKKITEIPFSSILNIASVTIINPGKSDEKIFHNNTKFSPINLEEKWKYLKKKSISIFDEKCDKIGLPANFLEFQLDHGNNTLENWDKSTKPIFNECRNFDHNFIDIDKIKYERRKFLFNRYKKAKSLGDKKLINLTIKRLNNYNRTYDIPISINSHNSNLVKTGQEPITYEEFIKVKNDIVDDKNKELYTEKRCYRDEIIPYTYQDYKNLYEDDYQNKWDNSKKSDPVFDCGNLKDWEEDQEELLKRGKEWEQASLRANKKLDQDIEYSSNERKIIKRNLPNKPPIKMNDYCKTNDGFDGFYGLNDANEIICYEEDDDL